MRIGDVSRRTRKLVTKAGRRDYRIVGLIAKRCVSKRIDCETVRIEKVLNPLILILCLVSACSSLFAQRPSWQPSPGHPQVPIWPGTPPDAKFGPPPNTETTEPGEVDN